MYLKNLVFILIGLLAALFSCTLKSNPPKDVYVVLIMGQSNAVGRAEVVRLSNKKNNPAGYVPNPKRVMIYDKGNMADLDLSKDNGVWKEYHAGINSNTDGSPLNHFGPELSLSQSITKAKKGTVYIIKAAFGGTALSPNIPTYYPGNWTEQIIPIAMDYYFKRAMRDLYVREPNSNVHFLGVIWYQGESDAAYGISKTQYTDNFNNLKIKVDDYLSKEFHCSYKWLLVGLNYNQGEKEEMIDSALCSFVNKDTYFVSMKPYPRKMDLTDSQKWPIQIGNQDDNHSSYIAQIALGKKAFEIFTEKSSS